MPQTTLSGKNRYKTENSRINLKAWQVKKKFSFEKRIESEGGYRYDIAKVIK